MAVLEAVQTFAGIANENEFYSHHYLAEVFKGDIKARIDAWLQREQESEPGRRRRSGALQAACELVQRWFALRGDISKRPRARASSWTAFAEMQPGLLRALGYASLAPDAARVRARLAAAGLAVLGDAHKAPQLVVVPAYNPGQEDDDVLDQKLSRRPLRRSAGPAGASERDLGRHRLGRDLRRRRTRRAT